MRAGLDQRAGSGRIGIGLQRPAGQEYGQGVIMRPRRQIGRRDTENWRNIHGRAAAEAVAAACKPVVMAMLMERRFTVMVGMFRAGLVVSAVQMKRSMGVAADKSNRQQQRSGSARAGIASRYGHATPKVLNSSRTRYSTGPL